MDPRLFGRPAIALVILLALLVAASPVPAHADQFNSISVSFQPTGTRCTEALAKGPNGITSVSASNVFAIVLCAHVEDAGTGIAQAGRPVEFNVSMGTVGASGTSRYSGIVFSTADGIAQISYRGDGKNHGPDTVVVTDQGGHAIATETIQLTPASGVTAAKIIVVDPSAHAMAIGTTQGDEAYSSPTVGIPLAVQVQDWKGLGVNNQVMLVSTDRGTVVSNPGWARSARDVCPGSTSKAIVLTSASTNVLAPLDLPMPGTADFVVCAGRDEEPGPVRVTLENISARVEAATITVTQAGKPSMITTAVNGTTVKATITDAAGAPVADDTPIRFTIPSATGMVSRTCLLSRNGEASVMVGLDAVEAAVLVTAEYNTAGAAATCTAPGSQRLTAFAAVSDELLRAR
ncbi:MAG: hypothetical protein WCL53_07695 [Chloroflexota bacterium]